MAPQEYGAHHSPGTPLRVAVWVKTFPARYETFIANQIDGLLDAGVDVHVFASRHHAQDPAAPAGHLTALEGKIHYRPPIPGTRAGRMFRGLRAACSVPGPRAAWRILRRTRNRGGHGMARLLLESVPFAQQAPFDLVHCQFGPLGLLAVQLRRLGLLRGRIVTAFRGYDMSMAEQDSTDYQVLFDEGELFLPVCDEFHQRLVQLGCPRAKVVTHRSGVDCEHLRRISSSVTPAIRPTIVSVARLVEKKGLDVALRAVAGLCQQLPELKYTIVGEGPQRNELQRLAAQLGIQANVIFTGELDHAGAIAQIATAHVFVLPSITASDGSQEGIPNALKEAMCLGIPVVTTRHAGIPELVEHGISGLLVPERNVDRLTEALHQILSGDIDVGALRRAALEKVMNEYSSRQLNQHLLTIYRGLCGCDEMLDSRLTTVSCA